MTVIMMKLVELLNKKCPSSISNYKEINSIFLNHHITSDDSDVISSMSNLIVSALIQAPKEKDAEMTKKIHFYLKKSLENSVIGKEVHFFSMETVFLSALSYWSCFTKAGGHWAIELIEFTSDKILWMIE